MGLKICSADETGKYLKGTGIPGEGVGGDAAQGMIDGLAGRSKAAEALRSYIDSSSTEVKVMFFKDCDWIQNVVFDSEVPAVMCNTDIQVFNKAAKTKSTLEVPLDLVLYHELGHAKQYIESPAKYLKLQAEADASGALKRDGYYKTIEEDNLARHEWPICDDISFPRRQDYTDFCGMCQFIQKKRAEMNWNLVKQAVAAKMFG